MEQAAEMTWAGQSYTGEQVRETVLDNEIVLWVVRAARSKERLRAASLVRRCTAASGGWSGFAPSCVTLSNSTRS